MARAPFPKARHIQLSLGGSAVPLADPAQPSLAEESEALAVSLDVAEREAPAPAAAAQATKGAKAEKAAQPPRALAVDSSHPARSEEQCATAAGERTAVRCPSSLEGREHAASRAAAAAQLGEAVLLDGLDRWWRLGPDGAGYCGSCSAALVERMRESYGEHVQPFDAVAPLRDTKLPVRERPFGGLRESLRLAEAVEAGKRAALRARDEARRQKGVELPVLGRVDALSPVALLMARHLDGLLFPMPSLDPAAALLPLLAARAALGNRPAVAIAPAAATAAQIDLLSGLCTACDVSLALEPGATREAEAALAAHRKYLAAMRERFRPASPLADLRVLASPLAEAWTAGGHFAAASVAAAAIARMHLQIDVILDLPAPAGRVPLVLAGCGAVNDGQAQAVRRHVTEGGDLLLAGRCSVVDDEGRVVEPLFADAKAGLNRLGEGRIWAVSPAEDLQPAAALDAQIARAARELLGRGRASLTLNGRGAMLVRGYLDPERKLDVHLVNLDVREAGPIPAQGLTLHLSGQIAGASRSGYWFAPDRAKGAEGERIALNPAGFGVSTVLPSVGTSALLTVPR